jgi:uncharacterized protein (DUF849 family)
MKTIISCAITGSATSTEKTPYLPITPEEIAESSLRAAEAGAALVHIHVRDPANGKASMELELYREVVDRIRQDNKDVIINLTTGPGGFYVNPTNELGRGITTRHNLVLSTRGRVLSAQERVSHIEVLRPDMCTLDCNTMHREGDGVVINHRAVMKEMIELIYAAGVLPEFEIFDSGDLVIAKEFMDMGVIKGTPHLQFAMGIKYGWSANPQSMIYAHSQLPKNCTWGALGVGAAEMPTVAMSAMMGGHVRVGLEDNIYVKKGVLATSNAQLVEMAKTLLATLGKEPASAIEARTILGLKS